MKKNNNTIIIFHSDIALNASADELDILNEAEFIKKGLIELGYNALTMPFKLNLSELTKLFAEIKPDGIFNLVESIEADGRLIHIAPSLFDYFKVPFFGCSTDAIILTSNKLFTKKVLENNKIPTPKYFSISNIKQVKIKKNEKYIFKSVWEHASIGMDENSIKSISNKIKTYEALKNSKIIRKPCFAEAYIDGREFNVSILGSYSKPEVLPIAEIKFVDYPKEKPKIVDYKAKWIEDSFEYKHTIRSYEFKKEDKKLYNKLKSLSLKCWKVFELNGYARIDFRVDKKENPFILEVNANPCISPEGGFIAATEQLGYKFTDVLKKIMTETNN